MSESGPPAELEEKQENRPLLPHMKPLRRQFSAAAFMVVVTGMFLFGVMLIVLYVASASGFGLHCISVGLFTSCIAFVFGVVSGLLLNIPQALCPDIHGAEIGRWWTRLLLGAGLVGFTALGQPLSALIHKIANGLGGSTASGGAAEPAVAMAGAILIAYFALGLLGGCPMITLWYRRWLAVDHE